MSAPGTYTYNVVAERMDNVFCVGMESTLSDCSYDVHTVETNTAVGIQCDSNNCITGDTRLVGGESEREGRVEVCSSGRWGTVCDNTWRDNHTAVVCRFVGFSDLLVDVSHYSSERFGEGTGPVWMDFVNCTGLEDRFWYECRYFTHYFGCSHENDVGIECQPARCSDGQIRLIGGSEEYYGRVEICSSQRWQALSSLYPQWNSNNARVACVELGFESYYDYRDHYGNAGGPRHTLYYQCTGSELRLSECDSYNDTTASLRSSYYDVGVRCGTVGCADGVTRLMEGETEFEGRLEMCLSGRWGTIGGDGWTDTNSQVVCHDFGYDANDEPANKSTPMAPSKPLYYYSVKCSSQDLSLLECGFTEYTDYTKVYPRAIVKCQEPTCEDGDLRLVGGFRKEEGRLEICFNKRWGTVDGLGWTHADTEVACRQLRYSTLDVSYTKTERTRRSYSLSLQALITLVGCYSSQDKLIDCPYRRYTYSTSMDVTIICGTNSSGTPDTPDTPGTIDAVNPAPRTMATASLSIAVFLAVVVAALVVVLIAVFVLRGRKKSSSTSGGIHYNKHKGVSLDDKQHSEDAPMEGYEGVEVNVNPLPIPPRSQPSKIAHDTPPTTQSVDPTRYARGSKPNVARKPPKAPLPPVAQWPQSRGPQWQLQPSSHSPEAIYECPD
jgi:hypothetical protein